MSGALKPGYKHTEIGIIPEDWRIEKVGDIATISSGGTPSRANPSYWGGDIPWITTTQVDLNVIREAQQYITREGMENSAAKMLPAGTLLMALYGQGKTRGKVAMLGVAATTNQACASISISDPVLAQFTFNYLTSQYEAIRASSNGGSQDNLSGGIVKRVQIPVPPRLEQTKITSALSDMDVLISSLDQLIEKKRDIQKTAMQQLLTGQRRLPGFSGEWNVKPMRALGNTYGGLAGKTKNDFGHGEARYIPFMNVMTDTVIDASWLEPVDVAPGEAQNLTKKGDLFFNGSSETPEEVGFCSVLLEEIPNLYLNSFCFGFRFNAAAKVNGLFFAYWFRSKAGRAAMAVLAQGATRYNVAKSAFLQLAIPQPSEEEQTAIASILTDMDTELAALEARRDKARQLKQGMMQELLTGRIRLV